MVSFCFDFLFSYMQFPKNGIKKIIFLIFIKKQNKKDTIHSGTPHDKRMSLIKLAGKMYLILFCQLKNLLVCSSKWALYSEVMRSVK